MKLMNIALALTTLMSVDPVLAASHFDLKTAGGARIYDLLLKQDVPEKALRRVFEFLDVNAAKTVVLKDKDREGGRVITETQKMTIHDDYATIIDYSKPSNQPRLYLMNLNTGNVEKYLVAHGRNSGAIVAASFSNVDDSKQSSLGLYVGGEIYSGKHGKSLQLHGLEPSNSNAMFRDIVIHSADYVSYDYIKAHGRLGRSWGCPAVSPGIIQRVLTTMRNGSVIYGYHKDLMTTTLKNPSLQVLKTNTDKGDSRDLPGEEEDMAKKGTAAKPATSVAAKPVAAKVETKPEVKAETKPEVKPEAKAATPAPSTPAAVSKPAAPSASANTTSVSSTVTPLKEQKPVPATKLDAAIAPAKTEVKTETKTIAPVTSASAPAVKALPTSVAKPAAAVETKTTPAVAKPVAAEVKPAAVKPAPVAKAAAPAKPAQEPSLWQRWFGK